MRSGILAALFLSPALTLAAEPRVFHHDGIVRPVAFSPDSKLLATGSYDRKVRLWDTVSGKLQRELTVTYALLSLGFSPDGKRLAAGTHQGELTIFQTATGRKLVGITTERGNVSGLSWSPDGKLIATADYLSSITLWNSETGKKERQLPGHPSRTWAVAFSPDGTMLASGGEDAVVRMWDVTTGLETRRLAGHRSGVGGVSFSRDGRLLVSASADGSFRLWDVLSGMELLTMPADAPHTAAFSPDGRFVAGAARDNIVRVWDSSTGKEAVRFEGHLAWALCVAFSADGKHAATTSQDRTARLWDLDGMLPDRKPITLTADEREKHWAALSGNDIKKTFAAMHALANDPESAKLLEKHLKPPSIVSPQDRQKQQERIAALVRDLGAEETARADRAMAELQKLGEGILPQLRQAHKKAANIEVLTRTAVLIDQFEKKATDLSRFRDMRAVAVLEWLGNKPARELLRTLGGGDSDSLLTREAKASLARLP